MHTEDTLDALRMAARLSPDNLALRRLLADQLLAAGYFTAAEAEFQAALVLAPGDAGVTIGLSEAFVRQGKSGAALVALEAVLAVAAHPPRADVIAARALLGEGETAAAAFHYSRAVATDPDLADPDIAARVAECAESPPSLESTAEVERYRITFAEVAGMDTVKSALRMKLVLPFQKPELFAAFGKMAGGGVLLYGPPGVGKTHLARATAGEIGAHFINVGLADILDMYTGSSERNLKSTFEMARRNAPCVLFFDEVESLAARRADMPHVHGRHLVNQFLAELDGVDDRANEGVLVLAATNAPWYLDVAFRRPGRFDQMIFVPPPDLDARAAILEILCRGKPLARVDFGQVSAATDGFVGADLKGVVDRAVEAKLHESIRAGHPLPITGADLIAAVRTVKPTAVREWLATAGTTYCTPTTVASGTS